MKHKKKIQMLVDVKTTSYKNIPAALVKETCKNVLRLFFNPVRGLHQGCGIRLRRIASNGVELSVFLCDNAAMRKLNKRYHNVDAVTDVLAFPQDGIKGDKGTRGQGDKEKSQSRFLGDVVISIPQAQRQGKENGLGFRLELIYLLIHGILHLMGHKDDSVKNKRRMFALQNRIFFNLPQVQKEAGATF